MANSYLFIKVYYILDGLYFHWVKKCSVNATLHKMCDFLTFPGKDITKLCTLGKHVSKALNNNISLKKKDLGHTLFPQQLAL